MELPQAFKRTIINVHKENGIQWLSSFDDLIEECERRWKLRIGEHYKLSYNFAAPVFMADGTEAVLKLSVPGGESKGEAYALEQLKGPGVVEVYEADVEKGILLLEKVSPGSTLAGVEDDEEAAGIAANLMKNLWVPAKDSSDLPGMEERHQSLQRILREKPEGLGPITASMLNEANSIFAENIRNTADNFLLHGDLHHYNILDGGKNGWIIIDPKGLIGEKEYDVIQYLLNRLPETDAESIISKRINLFAEKAGLERDKLISWGYAHSILSASWSWEESGRCEPSFFNSIWAFKEMLSKSRNA
ncbi:aminoglycoside phosphotransferase family protein [Bacillus infantis]|uniref:Hydrogenase expression protein HypB n=1 Tax=Bacillus infantis TaxID=324767 RepID=A0A5D4RQT7_9BACI|nr:aminoglycoside phosphotransferase family protein [Bacillus infantis]TYS52074.1 hydrogenase expression protein HypB [Bacillus infantis]